jgi:hypothetical protein
MRIVGEIEIDRPTLVERVLHLCAYLHVGQIGQKGKTTLSDAHRRFS